MTNAVPDDRTADFFQTLRDGFAFVAAHARRVHIDEARLNAYADSLPNHPPVNLLDPAQHFVSGVAEDDAAYILTLDSINFGSGYKPQLAAEGCNLKNGSIYYALSSGLKQKFEQGGPYTAADLAALDKKAVNDLFGLSENGTASQVFAQACVTALNETGRFVMGRGGRFMDVVNAANGDAAAFVGDLISMRHFDDSHDYQGRRVGIYKRAQIAAADLQLAFRKAGRELFSNIDQLTMFADNAVPHVLHMDGVLIYDTALSARIAAGQHLPPGSEEEVEIRAVAAHAVELIARRKDMSAMDVDHILWHRSAEDARYKSAPTHRTLSWFY